MVVKWSIKKFPRTKRFYGKIYRRYLTFPAGKRVAETFKEGHENDLSIKCIPVINLVGNKEYMIYIRKKSR